MQVYDVFLQVLVLKEIDHAAHSDTNMEPSIVRRNGALNSARAIVSHTSCIN